MSVEVVNRTLFGVAEYIGRPSPLGNPFVLGRDGNRTEVVAKYRAWLLDELRNPDSRATLIYRRLVRMHHRGEHVALRCWCAPLPCHGDVLKELIESEPRPATRLLGLVTAERQNGPDDAELWG